MLFKFTSLIIALSICKVVANAQDLSPSEKNQLYQKYRSAAGKPGNSSNDTRLIRVSRPLSKTETERLKPLRILSSDHFIISKKNSSIPAALVISDEQSNALWKASPQLARLWEQYHTRNKNFQLKIAFNPAADPAALLKILPSGRTDLQHHMISAEIQLSALTDILERDEVIYADLVNPAREELVINGTDPAANDISRARQAFPAINGQGITISFKEGMFDTGDIDLAGNLRSLPADLGEISSHATIMATLALGRGNSYIRGLGAAPAAGLTSSNFINLLPDDLSVLRQLQVNIQNHSYGTDLENNYGIEAAAYDQQIYEADTLLHVFSAGNKGTATPEDGLYSGLPNTANLTGNFKQAKNVLVTGGINRENISETLSSRGPAYDGRVKPEIVALGEDGTSGAAALTSGVAALVQQQYRTLFGKAASSALLRCIIINAADDAGNPHVDHVTGFGKLNAMEALRTVTEKNFTTGTVSAGQDFSFQLRVPSNQHQLKVTLAWNDPAAAINSSSSLVNHLDLSMETPSGSRILPWVLSTYPDPDSLNAPAVRKTDDINTVQQLTLDDLTPGTYTIHVKGRTVTNSLQAFALAYQLQAADTYNWIYPVSSSPVFAGEENYIRWGGTYTGQGRLSVSYDGGLSWNTLTDQAGQGSTFYKWTAPVLFSRAQLKMETGEKTFTSEPFIISSPVALKVGYNCSDKIMFHWSPQPSAVSYTLYNLKENVMVPVSTLTDTIALVSTPDISSPHFAVAANGADFSGLRGYTLDYTQQGVACYTQTLLARAAGEEIQLDLSIGSDYQLSTITWEKQSAPGVFFPLATVKAVAGKLSYSQTDTHPVRGVQFYRVTFETAAGTRISSDPVPVNFLKADQFVTYPNPVTTNLNVKSGDFEAYTLTLYNLAGQKVFSREASGGAQFSLSALPAGLYIGKFSRNGTVLQTIKVIKQ